jgi:hypothetical protein
MRGPIIAVALVAGSLVAAAGAAADGGPVEASYSPDGAAAPGVPFRYVALHGRNETVVAKVRRRGGAIVWSRLLPGAWSVPAVAIDGSAGGLTADGTTLVLTRETALLPKKRSAFVLLGGDGLGLKDRVSLGGWFNFDAISPDGRTLYLLQYLDDRDPTRYAVRAYDVRARRLKPDPIVDPNEHADEMRGYPLSRVYGDGGRWAYTLYDGGGKEPFVHALDTVAGRAVCIDAPMLPRNGLNLALTIRSGPGPHQLSVFDGKRRLALVDTTTMRASRPAPAKHDGEDPTSADGGAPWALIAALTAGAASLALIRIRRRRRLATG